MTGNYHQLALAQVRPGMVLSDVLLDVQGHVLLPQGTVLTEAMLALMPRHGIAMLPIQAPPPSPEVVAAQQAADSERLAYLFRKLDPDDPEDAATTLLRNYVTQYRLGAGEPA